MLHSIDPHSHRALCSSGATESKSDVSGRKGRYPFFCAVLMVLFQSTLAMHVVDGIDLLKASDAKVPKSGLSLSAVRRLLLHRDTLFLFVCDAVL